MESPQVESGVVHKLASFWQTSKLTRAQIGLAALALLTLLYAVLWIVVERPATVAQAQGTPPVSVPIAAEKTEPSSAADDGALSATFLGEYDRLSDASVVAEPAGNQESVTAPGTTLNTLFFSLLFVAGIAYAGIWGYKQLLMRQQGLPAMMSGKQLSVQETQLLGPNQRLHLVRLGNETLLLGATEHTITCLARYGTEYTDNSFDAHLAAATHQKPVTTPSVPQPTSLQESLDSLRKVQHRPHGGENA
jgi:flagellar biogenesis protein FliO